MNIRVILLLASSLLLCSGVLAQESDPTIAAPSTVDLMAQDAVMLHPSQSLELSPAELALREQVANILVANPSWRASIIGHTDSQGSGDFNLATSERKARGVADQLVALGVAAEQLDVQYYGESQPIASNATAEGRAQNSRVEIVFVRPE